jgi:general secretion pathway protein M
VATVVALTLAVPLALFLYIFSSVWSLGRSFQEDIDTLEPRIARLRGVTEAREELAAAAANAEATLKGLVYPAGDANAVSAALQKNVRGIMSGAGLAVADSRIESARREGAFDVIGLSVTASGGIEALDAALDDIVSYSPLLLVTEIEVSPARTSRRSIELQSFQELSVKMNLIALVGVE